MYSLPFPPPVLGCKLIFFIASNTNDMQSFYVFEKKKLLCTNLSGITMPSCSILVVPMVFNHIMTISRLFIFLVALTVYY